MMLASARREGAMATTRQHAPADARRGQPRVSWWVDAVGTTAMRLFVEPGTLVLGLVASLAVAGVAILWACHVNVR